MSTETVYLLSPEIALVAVAAAIYLLGAMISARNLWNWLALAGLAAAAAALAVTAGYATQSGPLAIDRLAYFARWLAVAMGLLLVLMTSGRSAAGYPPEYVGSLVLSIAGLMLAAAADELVLLFLGLELISIPTYILLYLGRGDAAFREATAKYFYLSILASALLLYGFSFLYGTTGSTQLAAIHHTLADPGANAAGLGTLAKVALVLIFAGLGFKIAAVPFHFYAPDVYQGTSNPNAGLLSVVPKAAGLVAMVRIMVIAMPHLEPYAWRVALALSLVTMTFANVVALWQDNLRRLLAYSSIAHGGYMLIGLAVGLAGAVSPGGWDGVGALLFYLCVYALATIGTFAALVYLGSERRQIDAVQELIGLGRTRPLAAAAITVFMFSLTGIPPLAGFWGKLAIFGSALSVDSPAGAGGSLRPWFVALAIAGVLNAAVAAAYYLRIVALMYFRTPLGTPKAEGGAGAWLVTMTCAFLVILIGLHCRPLLQASMDASPTAWAAGSRQQQRAEAGKGKSEGRSGSARSIKSLAAGGSRQFASSGGQQAAPGNNNAATPVCPKPEVADTDFVLCWNYKACR